MEDGQTDRNVVDGRTVLSSYRSYPPRRITASTKQGPWLQEPVHGLGLFAIGIWSAARSVLMLDAAKARVSSHNAYCWRIPIIRFHKEHDAITWG
jgi:hypothetical protein